MFYVHTVCCCFLNSNTGKILRFGTTVVSLRTTYCLSPSLQLQLEQCGSAPVPSIVDTHPVGSVGLFVLCMVVLGPSSDTQLPWNWCEEGQEGWRVAQPAASLEAIQRKQLHVCCFGVRACCWKVWLICLSANSPHLQAHHVTRPAANRSKRQVFRQKNTFALSLFLDFSARQRE